MFRQTSPKTVSIRHILASGGVLEGLLEVHGGCQIDGRVTGEVRAFGQSSAVLLGPASQVYGPVTSETVVVAGQVMGPIKARQVTLKSSAKVEGNIEAQSLHIEPGAQFSGQVSIVAVVEIEHPSKEIPVQRAELPIKSKSDETQSGTAHAARDRLHDITSHDRQQAQSLPKAG